MTDSMKNRFSAVTEQLRAASAVSTAPEEGNALSRFRRRQGAEQESAVVDTKPAVETTEVFKILVDANLDPKEKAEKIAALMVFNEEDLENNAKSIAENQAVVAQLMKEFIEHNKKSIELTRDNPLSELRGGIREVFEEYHKLVSDRGELKDKLTVIDGIVSKHGGAEGLIKALLSAKDKQLEKEALDQAILAARGTVDGFGVDVRRLDTSALALRSQITEAESDNFLWFKGEKKRQIARDKQERAQVEAELEMKRIDMEKASETLAAKTTELQTFVTAEDYQVHQQILEVLDIGTQDFKDKLTSLSNMTLSYIDNTSGTLEGVRLQLESLLGRVTGVHTATQNTVENVAIMLEAQEMAQKQNAVKMQAIEAESTEGGLAGMKREKKLRALHQHISATEKTTQSTASIAGELGKVQIDLTNFKDQMQEGLADAMEQEMLAVGSAAATGNATLMRIETLATFVQGLVTKGQYMQESEYHLGEIAKEMERSLMARMAKNEGIRNVADVLKEMTSAMDDRNDVVLQIAEDRKALIDRLIDQTRELGRTNEEALAIESTVNKKLYGSNDNEPNGQSGAGAPSLQMPG